MDNKDMNQNPVQKEQKSFDKKDNQNYMKKKLLQLLV